MPTALVRVAVLPAAAIGMVIGAATPFGPILATGSVTFAFSIITNRIWNPIRYLTMQPLRDNVFGGDEERFIWLVAGLSGWLGWTIPLLAVSWWLTRRPHVPPSSIPQSPDTLLV